MKEEWVEIEEFPNYLVSNYGEVVSQKTGASRKPSRNKQGHAKITLSQDGRLITRSVGQLVAQAFVPGRDEVFNQLIHLDGDYLNCRADNLMWRPRWFAIRYHRQFMYEAFYENGAKIVEMESGEHFANLKDVCTTFGLYHYDVTKSCVEHVPVPFTHQEFRYAFEA